MILRSNIIKGKWKYYQIVHSSRSWWYFMIFYCFWLPTFTTLFLTCSGYKVIFTSFSVIGRVLGCAGWWVTPIHFLYPQLSHSVTVFMLNISSSIKLAESEETLCCDQQLWHLILSWHIVWCLQSQTLQTLSLSTDQ